MDETQKNAKPSEAITTSSEPESFDSWTLVTDLSPSTSITSTEHQVTEDATKNSSLIENNDQLKSSGVQVVDSEPETKNHDTDDLSDGISIISENENAGRNSPAHGLLYNNESEKDENHDPEFRPSMLLTQQDTFQGQESPQPIESNDEFMGRFGFAPVQTSFFDPSSSSSLRPLLQGSISMLTTCLLALLVMSLLQTRFAVDKENNLSQLGERVKELELLNNFLRAEIDVLSKDLNSLNQRKDLNHNKKKYDSKTNWKKDSVHENSKDNKENMNSPNEKILNEQVSKESNKNPIENDCAQKIDPSLPTDCKDGENLWSSQPKIDPDDNTQKVYKSENQEKMEYQRHPETMKQYGKDKDYKNRPEKEYKKNKEDYKKKFEKREHTDSKESYERKYDNDSNEKNGSDEKEYKNYKDKYNQKFEGKRGGGDKPRDFNKEDDRKKFDKRRPEEFKKKFNNDDDDNSKEHYEKKGRDGGNKKFDSRERDDSHEKQKRYTGDDFKNSEKYKKYQNRQHYDHNDDDGNGDWHEKMMQYREDVRKNKKDESNWYLERGSGREEARFTGGNQLNEGDIPERVVLAF